MASTSNIDPGKLSDEEVIQKYAFQIPWQFEPDDNTRDPDGFSLSPSSEKEDPSLTRKVLQSYCWSKFNKNPQVNTSVRGLVGRMTGMGFGVSSDIQQIQEVIDEIEFDHRNRLWDNWRQYVGRSIIEGELFLCLTCHLNGFIEVDFIDPGVIDGENDDGVIFHPNKPQMPLFYCIDKAGGIKQDGYVDNYNDPEQIPSINIARYPELINIAKKSIAFHITHQKNSRSASKMFKQFGGYNRFIVAWNKGFVVKRNISHLRTVMEWLSHWENLKKYEIDHKKSSGSYVWVVTFEDRATWIQWLKLSDADRAKTGIAAKKTPGGTMVLGPGMKMVPQSPQLPKISEGDTDIMMMVTSGLNEAEDVTTGKASSPFASVKASRGPMSDRTSDEIAYFERWLRYDYWGAIFFLKSKINGFPEFFSVKKAVDFDDNKEPVFKKIKQRPEQVIEIDFPISEITEMESRARAMLGVKHGNLFDIAGIPLAEIIKRLGFGSYKKMRLDHATEQEKYPELIPAMDDEAYQEKINESSKKKVQIPKKKVDDKGIK